MKIILLMILLFVSTGNLIFAQSQPDEFNKVEVFAGFAKTSRFIFSESVTYPNEPGFELSAVYNVRRYIGIKADVSANFNTEEGWYISKTTGFALLPSAQWKVRRSYYGGTVGVQFKDNSREKLFKPFGHILVGYRQHSDKFKTGCPTDSVCPPFNEKLSGASLIIGGGLDFKLSKRFDVRLLQIDANRIFSEDARNSFTDARRYTNLRVSAGIVFKF